MEEIKKKKTWTRPQLIVLVRGKPEESVLQACKTTTSGGPFAGCQLSNPCSSTLGTS